MKEGERQCQMRRRKEVEGKETSKTTAEMKLKESRGLCVHALVWTPVLSICNEYLNFKWSLNKWITILICFPHELLYVFFTKRFACVL